MKYAIVLLFIATCSKAYSTSFVAKSAALANSAFKDFTTTVVWRQDSVSPEHIKDFAKAFNRGVILASIKNDNSNTIHEFSRNKTFVQTVFLASAVHEAEQFMALIYEDLVRPIRLFVVLTNPTASAKLKQLMEAAWKNDIADILVVNSGADGEAVSITTYFPYSKGKCGDFTPVALKEHEKISFPKKFRNFHGCQIKTTLLHLIPYSYLHFVNNTLVSVSGIDGNFLNILFEAVNGRMFVTSTLERGGIGLIVNGSATGPLADLVSKEADIMLPGLLMSRNRYSYVQYSRGFKVITIVWFGPRRRPISEWLRMLQPFMTAIAPTLFITTLVFVAVLTAARRLSFHRSYYKDSVLFQSFGMILGIGMKFETKSSVTNFSFVLWIWFCMVVRTAYQSSLVNHLQTVYLEKPLQAFESAVSQVGGYGGLWTLREHFFKDTRYYNDYKNVSFCNLTLQLKAIGHGERFLLLTDKLLGTGTVPHLQVLDEKPVSQGFASFHMRPGWPAAAEIDRLILNMIESGFMQKILRKYMWEQEKALEIKDTVTKPLTLQAVSGYFYGLVVMYGICILIFMVEIVCHRMKRDWKISS